MFGCCDDLADKIEALELKLKTSRNKNCEFRQVLSYFLKGNYIVECDVNCKGEEWKSVKHIEMFAKANELLK